MSTGTPTKSEAAGESVVMAVRAQLQRPRGERPVEPLQLDERLSARAESLRAAVASDGGADPAAVAALVEGLHETAELRSVLKQRVLSERFDALARIRESMEQLRECASREELIDAAPGELCRACGFTRAMISRIRGSKWVPERFEMGGGTDPEADAFKAWVEQAEVPLEHMMIETELVRRRMPALIVDSVNNSRVWRELVMRGRNTAYVAAPIIPDGRAIGFFHADRMGQEEQTNEEDRDNLWIFAEQFALIYHRAVLVDRLAAQQTHLHDAFAAAESVVEELCEREVKLARTAQAIPEAASAADLFRPSASRLASLLTRRELEVMDLITSGATNLRIGEQLVISEGTVKSHVKHILRKLHVGNRSEAVARYLQLLKQEQTGR